MQNRLLGLDLLRLLLALAVVIYHYTWSGAAKSVLPDVGPDWFYYGRYAILTFFMISGFVIARSMAGRDWLSFAIARFVRLYPSLLACATITFAVLVVSGGAFGDALTRYMVALSFFGIGFDLPLIDASYWTLVYEWRFYALVALLLAIGRARYLSWIMTSLSVAGGLAVVSGSAALAQTVPFFIYAPYFALGVVVSVAVTERWSPRIVAVIGANVISAILMMPQMILPFQRGLIAPQSVLECTLIVAGVVLLFPAFYLLKVPERLVGLVRLCGAMSYPVYLVHQVFGYRMIRQLVDMGLSPIMAIVVTVLMVLGMSWVVAEFVEKRMTPALRQFVTPRNLRRWIGLPSPAGSS